MEAGFKDVRFAESGSEALGEIEERTADLVLSDRIMPGMDGLELTRRIRDIDEILDHFTYIMLLSSKEEMIAISHAFEHGADDFVSKSALPSYLLPRIWAACRTAGLQQRPAGPQPRAQGTDRRSRAPQHGRWPHRRYLEAKRTPRGV